MHHVRQENLPFVEARDRRDVFPCGLGEVASDDCATRAGAL
jgi:hypothetical protein